MKSLHDAPSTPHHPPRMQARLVVGMLASALIAAGCTKEAPTAPSAAGQRPAVEVGTVTATPGDVGLVTELPGRVEASRVAQVRARAAGILQQRMFKEGSDVKAGQTLFRIDEAPYAAALDSAKANLSQGRSQPGTNASAAGTVPSVGRSQCDQQARLRQRRGCSQTIPGRRSLDQGSGAYRRHQLGLRNGHSADFRPNRSGSGDRRCAGRSRRGDCLWLSSSKLTLSTSTSPNPPTTFFSCAKPWPAANSRRAEGKDAASVRLVLSDGTEYEHPGKLLFSDLTVDSTTGQITLRAEVPNPKGELLPGLYLRVKLEQAQASNAITLPQQAVTRTQQGDIVNVVAEDGKVSQRAVKISAAKNNRWVVREGLQAGEKVMVDGFQKLQMLPPGTPVKAVPWQAPRPSSSTCACRRRIRR